MHQCGRGIRGGWVNTYPGRFINNNHIPVQIYYVQFSGDRLKAFIFLPDQNLNFLTCKELVRGLKTRSAVQQDKTISDPFLHSGPGRSGLGKVLHHQPVQSGPGLGLMNPEPKLFTHRPAPDRKYHQLLKLSSFLL